MIILLLIGALSGSWLIGGIIPTLVYYGLELLNVNYFLIATCIITAIVSLSIGSSWSTIATIGISLLAIGKVLAVPAEITAGAIISGGKGGAKDKMKKMEDCGITMANSPSKIGKTLFDKLSDWKISS